MKKLERRPWSKPDESAWLPSEATLTRVVRIVRVSLHEVVRARAKADIPPARAQHPTKRRGVRLEGVGRDVHPLRDSVSPVMDENIGESVPIPEHQIGRVRTEGDATAACVDRGRLASVARLPRLAGADARRQ